MKHGCEVGGARASVEVGDDALVIEREGATPVVLPYVDVDDLHDDNYTLRLTAADGTRHDLSMLGKAYGQLAADVRTRRDEQLGRDLLLTGVRLQDTFPAKLFGGPEPLRVELRLFEDLLVVVPERGTMWGLPFSFVDRVEWDEELYQVHVVDDEGERHVFGHLAKRSQEFREELARLLEALDRRTAEALGTLLPGVPEASLAALGRLMRDGRAARQDAVDPALWAPLEAAVAGAEERRDEYDWLKSRGPGWTAVGVKAREGSPAMWFFCPLGSAVAQEVTSEDGGATYLYRLDHADPWRSIVRLNRALLTLNFRREPIYASEEEIASGRFSRYGVALRKLPYLHEARERFLGRAIHDATWRDQVADALARA